MPPVTVGPLVQITGPSPLGGCTADDVPGQEAEGSIAFHESEIEPYIDVNPQDPDNLVTVWQQDRWSDGGARGLVSAVSDDGGATWTTVTPPRFQPVHRRHVRARDRSMGHLCPQRRCLLPKPFVRF